MDSFLTCYMCHERKPDGAFHLNGHPTMAHRRFRSGRCKECETIYKRRRRNGYRPPRRLAEPQLEARRARLDPGPLPL